MFVEHFEIINCTIIAFSRCDSITPQKTALSERSLCVRDQIPPLRNRLPQETYRNWETCLQLKDWQGSLVWFPPPIKDIHPCKARGRSTAFCVLSHWERDAKVKHVLPQSFKYRWAEAV